MKKLALLLAVAGMFGASVALAHLCNNVYRTPDRLIVKPEKPITMVTQSEQMRIFVVNNFPVAINDVALSVKSDDVAVEASVTPESLAVLRPGQRTQFTVRIKVAEGAPTKKHRLIIGLAAKQIGFEKMDEAPVPKLRAIVAEATANPSTRVLAAESLAKKNDPIGFQFLKEMASKSSPDYRSRAIRAMGRAGHASSLTFLRGLLQERDGYLKGNALIALALAKAPPASLEARLTDRDPFVKTCAKAGLAFLGKKDPVDALKEATKDPDAYVQVAAAWGLAAAGDKEAMDLLDKASGAGDDTKLRIFAGDMLISLPERQVESKTE